MSEPLSIWSIFAMLKPLLPNIIGGVLAIWRVKDDVKWSEKTTQGKVFTVLATPLVFVMATFFGYYFGGALIEFLGEYFSGGANPLTSAFIMILTTASSLRFLRMFMVKVEEVFELIFEGIKTVVRRFFKLDGNSSGSGSGGTGNDST